MTTAFARNVRAIREDHGLKQYELADELGVDRLTVNNWEMGKVKTPRQKEVLDTLKKKFGVSDKDLFGYDDGYYSKTRGLGSINRVRGAIELITSSPAYLPLAGSVHAGKPQDPDLYEEMIPVPYEIAVAHPDAYLLIVEGDCMDKVYAPGSLILVDPNMTPQNGSIAVVSIDGADYIMRKMFKGADTMILSPDSHNQEWKDIVITADDDHTVEYHGVVVWFQAAREMK